MYGTDSTHPLRKRLHLQIHLAVIALLHRILQQSLGISYGNGSCIHTLLAGFHVIYHPVYQKELVLIGRQLFQNDPLCHLY